MTKSTTQRRGLKPHYTLFKRRYSTQDTIVGWAFLLPAVILGLIFIIGPMVVSLSYSFTDAHLLKLDQAKFYGLKNFIDAFKDETMWEAFKNTMQFVICVVPLQLGVAYGLALILNSKIKCNTFFRWAFFVPVMLSLAVTSTLWMNLLNEQDGLINTLLENLGFDRQKFLSDPKQAMPIIIFISAWQGAGYQMLIFLSALKNIPKEVYEASDVDGANKWQKLIYITCPMIKSTFSFILVTTLIGAFRLITQPMIMTGGGPLNSTLTMSYYIYLNGIKYWNVGYSSAIALIYTIFMATIALTLNKVTGKDNT